MQGAGSLSPFSAQGADIQSNNINNPHLLNAPDSVVGARPLSQQGQELSITKIMNCVGSLMAPQWFYLSIHLLDNDDDHCGDILKSNGTEPMLATRHILEHWKEVTPKTTCMVSTLILQLASPNGAYANIIRALQEELEAGHDFLDHEYDQIQTGGRPLPPLQELQNILAAAESKAEAIGYQLLAYSDVIELTKQHRECADLLDRVIEVWRDVYPQRANLDNLLNALRSQEVGLRSVADTLDRAYPKTTQNHGNGQQPEDQNSLEAQLMSARAEAEFWRAQAQMFTVTQQKQKQQICQQTVRIKELESHNQRLQKENSDLGKDAKCFMDLYFSKNKECHSNILKAYREESNQKILDLEQRLKEQEALLTQEQEKFRQLEKKHQMIKEPWEDHASGEKKRGYGLEFLGADGVPQDAGFTAEEWGKINSAPLSQKRYLLLTSHSLPANEIMAEKLGLSSESLTRIRQDNRSSEHEGMRLFQVWVKQSPKPLTWVDYAKAVYDACIAEHKTPDQAWKTCTKVLRTAALDKVT